MTEGITNVAGIEIPSTDPIFLAVVGVHVLLGLACTSALSFAAAYFGRQARRRRCRNWARLHISGMGMSYVLLLIAFYVDNGKQLPVWKYLPHFTYWLLPLAVGMPLIIRALLWHPLARRPVNLGGG